jgi:ABC-type transport system substrate-binding protein
MWYWIVLIGPDFILAAMTTDSWFAWNDSGLTNPAYDKLYGEQSTELDQEKRRQLAWQTRLRSPSSGSATQRGPRGVASSRTP